MVSRLPIWVFLSIAMLCMGWALLPVIRAFIGLDQQIGMPFLYVVGFLMAGLMCGLTAMILLLRRQPDTIQYSSEQADHYAAAKLHACGLSILSGIPLANFLLCFFLWTKYRHRSQYLDYQGREALCFQVAIYLYLLLGLFMVFAVIGILAIPLILMFHLVATLVAIVYARRGTAFRYPANITVISRTPS